MAAVMAATAGISAVTLVGQWLALPWFVFDSYLGRMAPVAALALVPLSLAFGLLQWRPGRRLEQTIAGGLLGLVAVVVIAVGFRNGIAPQSSWNPDRWLTSEAALAAGLPVLPLSSLTAGLLLVAALVTGLQLLPAAQRHRWCPVGLTLSLVVLTFAGLNALGRAADVSLVPVGRFSISFWPSVALALFNSGLAVACGFWPVLYTVLLGESPTEADVVPADERRKRRVLLAVVLGSGFILMGAAFAVVRALVRHEDRNSAVTLTNVAELKLGQIQSWRRERTADARVLARVPAVIEALVKAPGSGASPALRAYLEEFRRVYDYVGVVVLDRAYVPVVAAPAGAGQADPLEPALRDGLAAARAGMAGDLFRGPNGEIWLDFAAPVRDGESVIGAVLLRVDARRFLFPFLARWPTDSASAETLLYRREGRWIVYLNDLRFQPDAALKFRLPVDSPELLAARAGQDLESGLRLGRDYRNVPVLGIGRSVPETTWRIVTKIDKSEAYQAVRSNAWGVILGFLLTLGGVGLVAGRFWRHRRRGYEFRQTAAEMGRQAAVERLGLVMRYANDIILVFDENMRVVEASDRAAEAYGYTAEELLRLTAQDLRARFTRAEAPANFSAAMNSGGVLFETTHQRKDGTEFPVEVSSRRLAIDGRPHVLSIVRNIAERRAHLTEVERLNRLYFVISEVNEALVRAREQSQIFADVCRILIEFGQFRIAWIGWVNPTTRIIDPVAVAGDEHGYVAGIKISADPEVPEGRGPSGRAFRQGDTYVCNDFFSDPGTVPWRERAARSGFNSSIALPLRREGQAVGLLTVYAAEKDYFNPRQIALLEETAGDISFALDKFAEEARRRAAEDALAASERRMQFLLATTPAVIFSLRAGGDYGTTFVSENVAQVLGFSPPEFLANPALWQERLHPEDRVAANASTTALTVDHPVIREYRFQHRDGRYRWMHDELQLVPAQGEGPAEIVGFWLDISARKEAEQALRDREALFSTIVNQAVDAMVLVDPNGRFVEFNRAAHEGLGYTREKFAALRIADIQGEHSPEQIRANIEAIRRQGGLSFESWHRHRSGELRAVRVSSRFVVVRGQEFLAAAWSDITEQRRMMDAVRASEERHRALFENMDLGVVYQDAGGAITAANPAATYILGLSLDQMQGRTPMDPSWRTLREDGSALPGNEHPAMVALRTGARVNGVVMGVRSAARSEVRWVLVDAVPETRPGETQPHRVFTIFADITARRRAEAELRKLSLALEQSPSSVVITDLAGSIEYVNARFTELTGYSREEAIGRNPRILRSGVTGPEVYEDLWRTIALGRVWRGEIVNRKKNGELFTELVLITPVSDAEGRPTHYVALKEDITERKRAEETVRQSEAKLRALLEKAPVALAHVGKTGSVVFFNERWHEIFGYTKVDVPDVATWWGRAYPDADYRRQVQQDWEEAVRRAQAEDKDIAPGEYRVTCANGEERVIETSGIVLGEELLATFVDLTARRQAEARLRKLSRTIEQAPLSVAITDLNGAIEYVNPQFCLVTGYTLDEVRGQNPRVLKSGETAPEVYREMWETLTRGQVWRGELRNKKKNGEIYVETAVIAPVVDERGRPTHYVALKEDITERRRTEVALRETQELYRLLAENTSDAIWLYDLNRRQFTYLSPATERLIGIPAPALVGQPMERVLSPAARKMVAEMLPARVAAFNAGDKSLQNRMVILEHVHADGHIIIGEVVTTLVAGPDGRATQLLGVSRDVTDRQKAADELRDSRDRLAQAEQIARLGSWSLDLASQRLTWSDEMYQILELDQATTQPSVELWQQFMGPEDREELNRAFADTLATHRRFVLGNRLFFADGRIKYIEGTGELNCDPTGAPRQAIGTVQDVTERKLIEIELHELVKGLRLLHDIAKALEQRDLSREQLVDIVVRGLPPAMAFPDDTRAIVEIDGHRQSAGAAGALVAQISVPITINDRPVGQITVGYVQPHVASSDGPFFVREREMLENIARTIGLGLGEREAFAAVQRFNAELEDKVAQRTGELEARNREVQALLNSIPDMVVRLRADGMVLNCQNAKGTTPLATLACVETEGSPCRLSEPLQGSIMDVGRRALAEETTTAGEFTLALAERQLTVELRAAPVGPEEFVVFVRDVTERKRLEAETTAMLEKERQVSEMKSRFISVTSHEFRTPIAAAMGTVELLHNHLDRIPPPKREEMFARITSSLQRMTEMLEDLLLLNRMDSGRAQVNLAPVNLALFVQSVVDEARLGDRGAHQFTCQTEGEAGEILTDTHQLHHILANLLSNAARYSPPDTVVTTMLRVDATCVRVTVEDQGIGIPEADQVRIFEAFERGSNVGTVKGTGLGLSIVKRMTQMLGGTIRIETPAGPGSRFVLEIPRVVAPSAA